MPKRGPGPAAGGGGMRGPMAFMGGRSTEKSLDFKNSSMRLLRMMRPERGLIALGLLISVASVTLSVTGPKVLGHATDLIFAGVISKQIPNGVTQAQLVARLRAEGKGNLADVIGSVNVTPGAGIDFTHVGQV
ncbi:MAG TPA: ABC transporter ATP-binding protein, partial [Actinocrinis sp.]|nr:ABC transporter ATP-binding protein [Actinocrinis sp.]